MACSAFFALLVLADQEVTPQTQRLFCELIMLQNMANSTIMYIFCSILGIMFYKTSQEEIS